MDDCNKQYGHDSGGDWVKTDIDPEIFELGNRYLRRELEHNTTEFMRCVANWAALPFPSEVQQFRDLAALIPPYMLDVGVMHNAAQLERARMVREAGMSK